ncbi:hypothetical protein Fmac_007178 [Flemingia macrophylla]|uniref:Anthocyanidin reductase n=1 Tax=Flemingia macrophylla TaxID=520843 RepID=A0ABD1ND89_9FABA
MEREGEEKRKKEMESERRVAVCVTGGSSYMGCSLVNKLLQKGYAVHSTLRNFKDESKMELLRGLPNANERLVLFEADIYRPHEYEAAIQGCEFVFHVATPYEHLSDSQNTSEAAIAGVESLVTYCIKSGTVRRLIYTASVVAASPLKEDGTGFKDFIDETCWTPLNLSSGTLHTEYTDSKTRAERELLSYGSRRDWRWYLEGPKRDIKWATTKLTDKGLKMGEGVKVCVTGGSGYIGSYLVWKLLAKGYTVHATVRDLKNDSKVGLLKSLQQSEGKLVLFEADIYNPSHFAPAIQGCTFVFHVATPMTHEPNSQYKDTTEAAVAGSKSIAECCLKAGTVQRLIYTATVVSASPLKEDGIGFKDAMDETCWTPLNDSFQYVYPPDVPLFKDYAYSKTLSEKHMLSYGNDETGGMEVVTLALGLVGGDTLQSFISMSVAACISQITQDEIASKTLKFLIDLLGKLPLVHIDDACDAHIFCMESTSISRRFLCASSYISPEEMANHYARNHPEFKVKQAYENGPKRDIKWVSTKLCDKGFVYKYDANMILDDCVKSARRMGVL